MAQKTSRRTAPDAPASAARFVRRSAAAIRARERVGQRRAEYWSLVQWATRNNRLVSFRFIEQFRYFGGGAEHRVYYDERNKAAVKATYPNRFGHSMSAEGALATPAEYLKRLGWHNRLFGDEIKIIGVAYEDDQLEIVISQPWINAHPRNPNPSQDEITAYFERFGFVHVPLNPDAPLYYHFGFRLLVGDAHDRNVIRDENNKLAAIDVVIGTPGPEIHATVLSCLAAVT